MGSVGWSRGKKKPRNRCRVRGFRFVRSDFSLPGHASARTSVGNKEDEYEGKKELAAKRREARDRREAIHQGNATLAVALRHVVDLRRGRVGMSSTFL